MRENNVVNFMDLKADPILERIGDVVIYDINHVDNKERREKIYEYIVSVIDKEETGGMDAEILGSQMIVNVFPILTNILLDTLSEEEIASVVESPSRLMSDVADIVRGVIDEVLVNIQEFVEFDAKQKGLADGNNEKQALLDELKTREVNRKKELVKEEYEAKLAELEA